MFVVISCCSPLLSKLEMCLVLLIKLSVLCLIPFKHHFSLKTSFRLPSYRTLTFNFFKAIIYNYLKMMSFYLPL